MLIALGAGFGVALGAGVGSAFGDVALGGGIGTAHSSPLMKTYNQSLQPTTYVAGAPSASAEFNRYVAR